MAGATAYVSTMTVSGWRKEVSCSAFLHQHIAVGPAITIGHSKLRETWLAVPGSYATKGADRLRLLEKMPGRSPSYLFHDTMTASVQEQGGDGSETSALPFGRRISTLATQMNSALSGVRRKTLQSEYIATRIPGLSTIPSYSDLRRKCNFKRQEAIENII